MGIHCSKCRGTKVVSDPNIVPRTVTKCDACGGTGKTKKVLPKLVGSVTVAEVTRARAASKRRIPEALLP